MTKTQTNLLQRVARGTFVGLCAAMAIGMIGAVSVRGQAGTGVTSGAVEGVNLAFETVAPVAVATEVTTPAAVELSSAKPQPKSKVVRMEVTGYCPCKKCCGPNAQGITASGKKVSYNRGRFVAADTKVLPFGTKLSIPGYHDGTAVEVIDRGGAIKGKKLDLYFPTHQAALNWGRQHVDVTVME
ncbi:MAG TPA: 3D domain-containing protein [Tepidisphaeraceae bacterium]|jgi:3D (Asp-Asp-Asp) domain-containing protein|nr:3D domain-containing protein [Tepidisphaeraceae bacterium]